MDGGLGRVSKCADCTKGPSGIAGHERLFSQSFGAEAMRFKCKACNFVWVRRTGSNGSFSWGLPAGEHPGMDVPGRPGTAPP
jgi:hypothetical protein